MIALVPSDNLVLKLILEKQAYLMLYHIISTILLWHNFLPSLIIQVFLDVADAQGPAYGIYQAAFRWSLCEDEAAAQRTRLPDD